MNARVVGPERSEPVIQITFDTGWRGGRFCGRGSNACDKLDLLCRYRPDNVPLP